jgi:hypothetical protein
MSRARHSRPLPNHNGSRDGYSRTQPPDAGTEPEFNPGLSEPLRKFVVALTGSSPSGTGMKGPLEEGWQAKVAAFAGRLPIRSAAA